MMPAEKSPVVPLPATLLIMLFDSVVVPEVADAMAIPTAENVPLLTTEPIILFETVALVTSLPLEEVADTDVPIPSVIPKTSGDEVCAILEMVLPDMIILFSKPTQIPPLAFALVLKVFWLMTVPLFFVPEFAPCE